MGQAQQGINKGCRIISSAHAGANNQRGAAGKQLNQFCWQCCRPLALEFVHRQGHNLWPVVFNICNASVGRCCGYKSRPCTQGGAGCKVGCAAKAGRTPDNQYMAVGILESVGQKQGQRAQAAAIEGVK